MIRTVWTQIAAVMLALGLFSAPATAQGPLHAVASFGILGDMVAQIGGDRVAVVPLVGPGGDVHVFQPSPADARAVAKADLLFVNGLGFEGWIDRLVEASGYRGPVIVASVGVAPLQRDHGPDPHAWQDLANARIYARTIAAALGVADPDGRAAYAANLARYLGEIDVVEQEILERVAALPAARRIVVTSHDAFGYFERAYELRFVAPQGVATDSEASATDVAALIRQIRAQHIPALFVESITDPRLLEQVARETGVRIGGALYSDSLSPPDGPAAGYLEMMRHNIDVLGVALMP